MNQLIAARSEHRTRKPLVVGISIAFESELQQLAVNEGPNALSEYFLANPTHRTMIQPLMTSVLNESLNRVIYYVMHIEIEDDDQKSISTSFTSYTDESFIENIKAYSVPVDTFIGDAVKYIDTAMERYD